MTDLERAQAIANGDTHEEDEWISTTYPSVLRLLVRLTNSRLDAEDLVQQTFIAAKRNILSYQGKATLKTWLHQVAINEYRMWTRRRRWTQALSGSESQPDSAIQVFEAGYALTQALRGVPERDRIAFVLFEIEQLSMREVAQALAVPEGTAKARVCYARRRLRSLLMDPPSEATHEPN